MFYPAKLYINFLLILISVSSIAQKPVADTLQNKSIIARESYKKKSSFYQWLWGRNRRVEWGTRLNVPVLWLDTLYGGIKPYEKGGGNESKSLHLRTVSGKEYALHSINKSRDDVIPPDFKNTFFEDIVQDNVSASFPYGGVAITGMLEKAGIYHARPVIGYLPKQAALDSFNDRYGDNLYMIEERADGNWSNADNLGNFKDFSSTEKVIEKLQENNKYEADQHAFIKARLFDMLIGDWDRHEGNWRWGKTSKAGKTLYVPIPRDRDQAFFTHNGVALDLILYFGGYYYMQNFDDDTKSIKYLNIEEGDIDRFFTNELSLDDWVNAAKELRLALTDTVIAASVRQLPPEIFAVCGNELIEKIRSRCKQLVDFATRYYLFVAKEVEIVGTKEREYFDVKKENSGETSVSVYRLNNLSQKENIPYYKRTFKPNETKEIRIYGINGEDKYSITDHSPDITLRIIGGPSKDSIIQSGNRIHIYDNRDNVFQTRSVRSHLSSNAKIHTYKYENYHYDSISFFPSIVGVSCNIKKYKWRRDPYSVQHTIAANYSFPQHAYSGSFTSLYPNRIANWDLLTEVNWDAVKYTNFYGYGNETVATKTNTEYYRMRNTEWFVLAGLHHGFGKNEIALTLFYQRIKIKNDTDRFASKMIQPVNPDIFQGNSYAGLRFTYTYLSVNDSIVPTKGFTFLANGMCANNFTQKDFFQNYSARLQIFFPLSNKFSLAIRAGGATIVGPSALLKNAQIYEHAVIGGPQSLRGYRTQRFWGKSSLYNNNEFRFITNLRSYLLNAKIGLIAFFDEGRVWMPNETSGTLHTAYGGGILLAPFHRICLTTTYGISNEARLVQVNINTLF